MHIDASLLSLLSNAGDILCISHVSPDGDAIGSLLGMGWLLRALGKAPTLALQDDVPDEHHVLPGAREIVTSRMPAFAQQVANHPFDLVICLDASSPDRMGTAYHPAVHAQSPLVVIDHHITNTRFGSINWVAPECAATCQMLVYLADAVQAPLEGPLAECLLTGIITDTLCFRTSNTTPAVLEAAMRLMQGGADLSLITERTVNRRSFNLIQLWGLVLPSVQLEERVIWATVTRAQLERAGLSLSDISLSSFLITAGEADISAVFMEKLDGQGRPAVECSFRAKRGFDVAEVAFALGGGGHPAASGCTLPGTLAEATARVVTALREARRQQANALPSRLKSQHGQG
jgi:phosphoesterase RecJ-like protein